MVTQHQALMVEAVRTSETSVNYQTALHTVPEGSHFHTQLVSLFTTLGTVSGRASLRLLA